MEAEATDSNVNLPEQLTSCRHVKTCRANFNFIGMRGANMLACDRENYFQITHSDEPAVRFELIPVSRG